MTQGTFAITTARKKLGFTPSTAVRAGDLPLDVGTGAAIGQALLGSLELYRQYDIKQANSQLSESQRKANVEINDLKIRMQGNLDPDTYQADYDQTIQRIQTEHAPKNNRGQEAYNLWLNGQTPRWQDGVDQARIDRADDNWDTAISGEIATISSGTDPEALGRTEAMIARRQLGPSPLDKSKAAKLLRSARVASVEGQLANLKKAGMAGQPILDKDGKPENAFDKARELVNSTDIFTSEEQLAELRSIDMMEDFTKRKTEDLKFERDMAINEDFIQKIINKNLLPDEIQKSRLDEKPSGGFFVSGKLSKQQWLGYAESSFLPRPEVSTFDGTNKVITAIIDYGKARNGVDKEAAYREILDARYSDMSITDEDFQRALNRIDNKYPREMINDIEAVTENNKVVIQGKGFFDKRRFSPKEQKKAELVNSELLIWIDSRIEAGKEPTRDEMYEAAKILTAQDGIIELDDGKKTDMSGLSDEELLKRIKR